MRDHTLLSMVGEGARLLSHAKRFYRFIFIPSRPFAPCWKKEGTEASGVQQTLASGLKQLQRQSYSHSTLPPGFKGRQLEGVIPQALLAVTGTRDLT